MKRKKIVWVQEGYSYYGHIGEVVLIEEYYNRWSFLDRHIRSRQIESRRDSGLHF
jgi:hypothetical protein